MENMEHYLLLKSFHILGVILFLGNIIVTGFWKAFADYSKEWKIIAFSQRLVTYTDVTFTTLGVCLIAVTGVLMAKFYADFQHIKWIVWGLELFIASGLIWLLILIPIQFKLYAITKKFTSNESIPKKYWTLEKMWMVFGSIATFLPLMNLYWMVFKPT
jgi:uncharacterized membrane protein